MQLGLVSHLYEGTREVRVLLAWFIALLPWFVLSARECALPPLVFAAVLCWVRTVAQRWLFTAFAGTCYHGSN